MNSQRALVEIVVCIVLMNGITSAGYSTALNQGQSGQNNQYSQNQWLYQRNRYSEWLKDYYQSVKHHRVHPAPTKKPTRKPHNSNAGKHIRKPRVQSHPTIKASWAKFLKPKPTPRPVWKKGWNTTPMPTRRQSWKKQSTKKPTKKPTQKPSRKPSWHHSWKWKAHSDDGDKDQPSLKPTKSAVWSTLKPTLSNSTHAPSTSSSGNSTSPSRSAVWSHQPTVASSSPTMDPTNATTVNPTIIETTGIPTVAPSTSGPTIQEPNIESTAVETSRPTTLTPDETTAAVAGSVLPSVLIGTVISVLLSLAV